MKTSAQLSQRGGGVINTLTRGDTRGPNTWGNDRTHGDARRGGLKPETFSTVRVSWW